MSKTGHEFSVGDHVVYPAHGVGNVVGIETQEVAGITLEVYVITFDHDLHDFGRLSAGESISYSFHFRNTGSADLIITSASATCGCTVASYPKERIAPGGEGYVTVTFKSAGKAGQQYQEVTLMTNAQPATTTLRITARVGA